MEYNHKLVDDMRITDTSLSSLCNVSTGRSDTLAALLGIAVAFLVGVPALSQLEPSPIAEAKNVPFGSMITIGGRITVANEFGGPAFVEDRTGGIAVFIPDLHTTVQIGDSVLISGVYVDFQNGGIENGGLGQIAGNDAQFQIVQADRVVPQPLDVNLEDIDESLEARLVRIQHIFIEGAGGAFQGNTNYRILGIDRNVELRIDNQSALVGKPIPFKPLTIVAVVSHFQGRRQILPRFAGDIDIEPQLYAADSIAKELTFDIATWNLNFFGDAEHGPENCALQLANVVETLDSMDADLVGVQEIADAEYFDSLVQALPQYDGILATDIEQPLKTGFLYKPEIVEILEASLTVLNATPDAWAGGRYPFRLEFIAHVQGAALRMHAFVLHAKATRPGTEINDVQRRTRDARQLYDYLDEHLREERIIVLGDFNDDLDSSVVQGFGTPYAPFVRDSLHYEPISLRLSRRGRTSFAYGGQMIDHIIVSNELRAADLQGAERVVGPCYVSMYLNTTSDHYPVMARLRLDDATSVTDSRKSKYSGIAIVGVAPMPIIETCAVQFSVETELRVQLSVIDIIGRLRLQKNYGVVPAGTYSKEIDVRALTSGIYYVVVSSERGKEIRALSIVH